MYTILLFFLSMQKDVLFEYSVEQFVIQSSVQKIEKPKNIQYLIYLLDSDDYRARNVATKELIGMGRKIHQYLYWEINNPSLEVRWRIRKIIQGFNTCLNCGGIGKCTVFKGYGYKECLVCQASWYRHGESSQINCPLCRDGYVIKFDIENIYELYK